MEQFKLKIFKEENPDLELSIISLDYFNSGKVIGSMIACFQEDPELNTVSFFKLIESKVDKINCQEMTSVLLEQVLVKEGMQNESEVFIIWDLDTVVDKTDFTTLIKYWDYIWYDTSDEAVILFFIKPKLIVLITEWGYYSIIK